MNVLFCIELTIYINKGACLSVVCTLLCYLLFMLEIFGTNVQMSREEWLSYHDVSRGNLYFPSNETVHLSFAI